MSYIDDLVRFTQDYYSSNPIWLDIRDKIRRGLNEIDVGILKGKYPWMQEDIIPIVYTAVYSSIRYEPHVSPNSWKSRGLTAQKVRALRKDAIRTVLLECKDLGAYDLRTPCWELHGLHSPCKRFKSSKSPNGCSGGEGCTLDFSRCPARIEAQRMVNGGDKR